MIWKKLLLLLCLCVWIQSQSKQINSSNQNNMDRFCAQFQMQVCPQNIRKFEIRKWRGKMEFRATCILLLAKLRPNFMRLMLMLRLMLWIRCKLHVNNRTWDSVLYVHNVRIYIYTVLYVVRLSMWLEILHRRERKEENGKKLNIHTHTQEKCQQNQAANTNTCGELKTEKQNYLLAT